jgi:hypothetical protein
VGKKLRILNVYMPNKTAFLLAVECVC